MSQKDEITRFVLKTLEISDSSYKSYYNSWWFNKRQKSKGGLRLTEAGHTAFQTAGLKSYHIDFDEYITNPSAKLMLQLDNFIDSPFYICPKFIEVYTEKMAIQLVLFSGNIEKFLAGKQRSLVADKQHEN